MERDNYNQCDNEVIRGRRLTNRESLNMFYDECDRALSYMSKEEIDKVLEKFINK